MDQVDTDPNFEPQQRARSNTWPQPRPDNYVDKDVDGGGTVLDGQSSVVGGVAPKKNSSRRNAWGNMSYADLITQAIQSSPETRLTLSQIYDWMVQNVPYFKDKGDSNSSAGWKNSIRHNLSLHNRFMRVQNEGTGKSSWWMINPDAKPGKAARRRATSMETQKYEKRRGRVKKKVDALRNGLDATPSPSSSISESLDIFPDSPANLHPGFQLSPDFRPRASSNASSCGRLSPIPALEGDQSAPLSPLGWPQEQMGHIYGADQLVESITETMKLGRSTPGNGGSEGAFMGDCGTLKTSPTSQLSPHLATQGSNGYMHAAYASATSAGQYADYHASTYADPASKLSPLTRSPQRGMQMHDNANTSFTITNLQALSPAPSVHSLSPPHSMDTTAPPPTSTTSTTTSSSSNNSSSNNNNSSSNSSSTGQQQPQQQPPPQQPAPQPRFGADRRPDITTTTTLTASLLNPLQSSAYRITSHPASRLVTTSGFCALTLTTPASVGPQMLPGSTNSSHCLLRHQPGSSVLGPMPSASQMMGHLMAINSGIPSGCGGSVVPNGTGVGPNGIGIPNDLDLSIDSFQSGLECDVDQVIRHELSVDGNLDFNFAEPNTQMPVASASSTGHHWVH